MRTVGLKLRTLVLALPIVLSSTGAFAVLPDLRTTAVVQGSYYSGQVNVQIQVTVLRTGGALTNGTYVHAGLYWSTNSTWEATDQVLWQSNNSIPDFPNTTLNSNGSKSVIATMTLPSSSPGTYFIIAVVDIPTNNFHPETDENNNTTAYAVSLITPNPPNLSSPSDAAIFNRNTHASITFSWASSVGATAYWLNVFPSGNAANPVFNGSVGTSTSQVVNMNGFQNGEYIWQVRAGNGTIWGSYGTSRKFITDTPPGAPTASAPSDGTSFNIGSGTTFSWTVPSGGTIARYYLRIVPGTNLNNTPEREVPEQAGTSRLETFDGPPYTSGLHTWAVRAIKVTPNGYNATTYETEIGWGNYSTNRSFTLISPGVLNASQAVAVVPTRTNPATMYALPSLSEYGQEAPFDDEKNGAVSFRIKNLGGTTRTLSDWGVLVTGGVATDFRITAGGSLVLTPGAESAPFNKRLYLRDDQLTGGGSTTYTAQIQTLEGGVWTNVPGSGSSVNFSVAPRPPLANGMLVKRPRRASSVDPEDAKIYWHQNLRKWHSTQQGLDGLVPGWSTQYYVYPTSTVAALAAPASPNTNGTVPEVTGRNLLYKYGVDVYIVEPEPSGGSTLVSRLFEDETAFSSYGYPGSVLSQEPLPLSSGQLAWIRSVYPIGTVIRHPVLDVVFPDGGQALTKGGNYTITWDHQYIAGTIQIELYKGGTAPSNFVMQLAAAAPDNGHYPFTPPSNLSDGSDYKIGISAQSGAVSNFSASYFAISTSPLGCQASNPTSATVGTPVVLSGTASAPGGGLVQFDWNFGDGSPHTIVSTATGTVLQHVYATAGSYTWTLTSSSSGYGSCVRSGLITVTQPSQYQLAFLSAPPAEGVVTATPPGPSYAPGTSVQLTAQPASGADFVRWTGDASGSSNPVTIVMNGNKSVTGNFTANAPALSGDIGISNGARLLKFKGAPDVTKLEVCAQPTGGSAKTCVDAVDSHYSFPTLPSSSSYQLTTTLTYRESITVDNSSGSFGCGSATLSKKSVLVLPSVVIPQSRHLDIVFAPPIVFVHGFIACYTTWYGDDASSDMWDNIARASGLIAFTPNYHWKSEYSLRTGAREVETAVASDLDALVVRPPGERYPLWFYVAHSMGGVVGRDLVVAPATEVGGVRDSLLKLYLLGTPSSGTDAWPNGPTFKLSKIQMQSVFNPLHKTFGDKPVYAYAGNRDFSGRTGDFDGVVPIASVRGIYTANCVENPANHSWNCSNQTLVFRLPSEVVPYAHFTQFLASGLISSASGPTILEAGILTNMRCVTSGTCRGVAPATPNDEAPTGAFPTAQAIQEKRLALGSYGADSWGVRIGRTDDLVVTVAAETDVVPSVDLIDSFGHAVPWDSLQPSEGGVVEIPMGRVYSLANPQSGIWTVSVHNGSDPMTAIVRATESSTFGIEGFVTTPTALPGEPVALIAQWSGTATALADTTVEVQIEDGAGTVLGNVALHDDGNHADGPAGDGVFGGAWPAASTPGDYTVTFSAEGTESGVGFERWSVGQLTVLDPMSPFTGQFDDGVFDTDQDGLYDRLAVSTVVTVTHAGVYSLAADLRDVRGYYVAHAIGSLDVSSSGGYSISMVFDLSDAKCEQFDGPFSVEDITLVNSTARSAIGKWAGSVATGSYSSALFSCLASTASPVITTLNPPAAMPGESRDLAIGGVSFADGAQVSLGSGVAVTSTTVLGSTSILVHVTVSSGATLGARDVTVTNADGRSGVLPVGFTVRANQPPVVRFGNLADGQSVRDDVLVSVQAADDIGVSRVELRVDGQLVGVDLEFPYQFDWNAAAGGSGPHVMTATAFDSGGQSVDAELTVVTCTAEPSEIVMVSVITGSNGQAIVSWSAQAGASYQVLQGLVREYPVGSGVSEACLATTSDPNVTDALMPAPNSGFWYLVRSRTACGPGSYGQSSNGTERTTDSCP